MRALVSAGAVVAIGLLSPVNATQATSVTGTVTATGLRTNADVVVSLQAPNLTVAPPAAPAVMDQRGMLFVPHVLVVVTGTTVRFLNSDPVAHNVFSPDGKYNLGTWPRGDTRDHTYTAPGVYVQLCRVHPEMEGYVVVLDTPYFAITDRAGAFKIANVPAGSYTLVAWSEKLKETRQAVTVEAGKPLTVNVALRR